MSTLLIVLAAALFSYVLFLNVVRLAGSTIKVRGFELPTLFALGVACSVGIGVWALFEAFGIKPAAIAAAVVIEALALRSLCSRSKQNDSPSIWLLTAFALGGLFLLCIALLA